MGTSPVDRGVRLTQSAQALQAGRFEDARAILAKLLQQQPADVAANSQMSVALAQLGNPEEALKHALRAVHNAPPSADMLLNLGNIQTALRQYEAAVATLNKALALDPRHIQSLVALSHAQLMLYRHDEAARTAERGLEIAPFQPGLLSNYTAALLHMGEARKAYSLLKQGVQRHPGNLILGTGLPHAANYAGGLSREEVLQSHRPYAAAVAMQGPQLPFVKPDMDPERPLRIGFVSSDLRAHSVAYFLEPLFERIDREGFHVHVYSTATVGDGTTDRLRRLVRQWRDVSKLQNAALAQCIRSDAVDILFDLHGHTVGHRLPVFQMKPAPVQVSYIGYPNTTGLRAMDYRFVDSLTDPVGAEAFSVERLVRLDPCFLCYRPPYDAPKMVERDWEAPIVFGSFNALSKQDDLTLDAWSQVLRAVPGSTLRLKHHGFTQPGVREQESRRFAARGIDGARVLMEGPTNGVREHLARYGDVDIALDTFPYNGTTTTCEALLMGVPVVSWRGDAHAGRVGLTLLSAVGLPELVAGSAAEFVSAAVGLASNRARLRELRAGLRSRLLGSTLCDNEAFARRFETAVRQIWRAYVAGRAS
jgi:predicted O-linked N-acetylglucosamine transferase (SPINDLY family)